MNQFVLHKTSIPFAYGHTETTQYIIYTEYTFKTNNSLLFSIFVFFEHMNNHDSEQNKEKKMQMSNLCVQNEKKIKNIESNDLMKII